MAVENIGIPWVGLLRWLDRSNVAIATLGDHEKEVRQLSTGRLRNFDRQEPGASFEWSQKQGYFLCPSWLLAVPDNSIDH